MKRLWWYLLDELCSLAAENLIQGNFEVRTINRMKYIYPMVKQ